MGSFGVGSTLSIDEYIGELWHVCLAIGVPYSVYWHEDHENLVAYLRAYQMKRDLKLRDIETATWIMGSYVAKAVAQVLLDGVQYPETPTEYYPMAGRKTQEEIEQERLERIEQQELAMIMAVLGAVDVTQ